MDYVTTNIRIPEEDYLQLKEEAFKRNISLSALIREKISRQKKIKASVKSLLGETRKLARENATILRGWNSLKALREIRSQGK